ncbi:MAG TPA: hypothetical protein VKK31_22115 [Thermoanaerobaculia bacterium]|nr:hypothetical protein [Thermoanaerobaculia bacterium]
MNPLLLLFLGMALGQPANQNIVRVCSVAADSSATNCQDLDARLLEPAAGPAAAAGQTAFIDPVTKTLVQPTEEQLEELSFAVSIDESMAKRGQLKVQRMPNGTLKLGPGSSFAVNSEAVVEKKEKP